VSGKYSNATAMGSAEGTQFTGFTGRKVQLLLTQKALLGCGRYSFYLLYWYKSTNTDAEGDGRLQGLRSGEVPRAIRSIRCRCTQFTCFTSTKVQILTPVELRRVMHELPVRHELACGGYSLDKLHMQRWVLWCEIFQYQHMH
jgi:hypothetical protein